MIFFIFCFFLVCLFFFFFQAEDGIRDGRVTGVQTCALPISAATFWLIWWYVVIHQQESTDVPIDKPAAIQKAAPADGAQPAPKEPADRAEPLGVEPAPTPLDVSAPPAEPLGANAQAATASDASVQEELQEIGSP